MAPLMVPRRSHSEDLGLRALAQEMRAIARRLTAVTRPPLPGPALAWRPVDRRTHTHTNTNTHAHLRFMPGGLWRRR